MNSILAVESGLPPGLWLPLPEESTEKYRSENFNRPDHDYEEIVDFGSFAVAMAVLGSDEKPRISYMPTQPDLRALYKAGYGVSPHNLYHYYGGEAKLQRALGFYPDGFRPTREELLERLRWMAQYTADPSVCPEGPGKRVDEIMTWGSVRDILPSSEIILEVLGGKSTEVQKMFAIEKPNAREQLSFMDLYRFGARVIRENGGPVKQATLTEKYKDVFLGDPYWTIRAFFGGLSKFWLEFGYVDDASGMTDQDLVNLGVRRAISIGGLDLSKSKVSELSAKKQFPSTQPISRVFGGMTEYRARVEEEFQSYQTMREGFLANGISDRVLSLAFRYFEAGPDFEIWLKNHTEVLLKLSTESDHSGYVNKLIEDGFNLEDEVILTLQRIDFNRALKNIGVTERDEKKFVFDLMPRVNADEVLDQDLEQ